MDYWIVIWTSLMTIKKLNEWINDYHFFKKNATAVYIKQENLLYSTESIDSHCTLQQVFTPEFHVVQSSRRRLANY